MGITREGSSPRPKHGDTAGTASAYLPGRTFLLLVAVVLVVCLQSYAFHTSLLSNPVAVEEEALKFQYQEMHENSIEYWKEKYSKQTVETTFLQNEIVKLRKLNKEKLKRLEATADPAIKRKEHAGESIKPPDDVASPKKNTDKKLNILLLYADDWRYDTFGAAGNKVIKTPVLDKLAKEGILFSHNCVTTSICGISRATLQTGQYFSRHEYNPHQRGDHSLPKFLDHWNETMNGLLRSGGYHVGHVGKWHSLGNMRSKFDVFKSYSGFHVPRDGSDDHITAMNERDALEFLSKRPKDKPFMLTVSFFATHAVDGDPRQYIPQKHSMSLYKNSTIPMAPTATEESWNDLPHFFKRQNEGRSRWRKRYNTSENYQHTMKNIYRMVTEVDTTSGRIIDELNRQGVLDNTLVMFTTDNGNFHAEHGLADKWYPHQESIRVPLVIKDPRMPKNKIGSVNNDFTLNIDLAPTIVSAAGLTPPKRMQGRDMADLYLDEANQEAWREYFFYEHPEIDCSVCIPGSEAFVIKDSSKYMKYMYWPAHDYEQLFDLNADPHEEHDLANATQYGVELQAMRELFMQTKKQAL